MENSAAALSSGTPNLKRLFGLRTLVIASILIALPATHLLTGLTLPLPPLLVIIALLCVANLWTWKRIRSAAPISDRELFVQLAVDVAAIAGGLYFTGGASNPFAWFFLIPLIISATVLPAAATWSMALLTCACYTLLMFFYVPLTDTPHLEHDERFAQHVFGMWFGFVLSAALISWFIAGMARTLRERDRLLALAREQTLRNEQLVALGTLATGAAHELGTPLATMAVLTHEMQRNTNDEATMRKLTLVRDQIERCKRALSILSASAGEVRAESGSLIPVQRFLDEVVSAWRRQRLEASIATEFVSHGEQAQIVNEYTLHQALLNLLNNAADVSARSIKLTATWNQTRLDMQIEDDGPGLQPAQKAQLGKPMPSEKEYGMGLGLVLTHATIQRLGGEISLVELDQRGTCTRVRLPLTAAGADA